MSIKAVDLDIKGYEMLHYKSFTYCNDTKNSKRTKKYLICADYVFMIVHQTYLTFTKTKQFKIFYNQL